MYCYICIYHVWCEPTFISFMEIILQTFLHISNKLNLQREWKYLNNETLHVIFNFVWGFFSAQLVAWCSREECCCTVIIAVNYSIWLDAEPHCQHDCICVCLLVTHILFLLVRCCFHFVQQINWRTAHEQRKMFNWCFDLYVHVPNKRSALCVWQLPSFPDMQRASYWHFISLDSLIEQKAVLAYLYVWQKIRSFSGALVVALFKITA